MRKINIVIGAAIFTALIIPPSYKASAAANCDFTNGLKELSKAQAVSMSDDSSESIKNELTARKNLINQAIDCSTSETLSLQSDIKLVDTGYPGLEDIQNSIISKLDDALNYYQAQKNSVNDLGIEGSKTFSINLKSWRDSNYVPVAELGRNFIIFAKNQYILQTTQNRFNQISITLKTLQLADNQKINDYLNQADKNLGMANDENEQIKDAFKTMAWPNDISGLIDSSLGHMKDTYQSFFDISKEAQDIISSSKQ